MRLKPENIETYEYERFHFVNGSQTWTRSRVSLILSQDDDETTPKNLINFDKKCMILILNFSRISFLAKMSAHIAYTAFPKLYLTFFEFYSNLSE